MALDFENTKMTFQFQRGNNGYRDPSGGTAVRLLPWAYVAPGNEGTVYLATVPPTFFSNHVDAGMRVAAPSPVSSDAAVIYLELREDNPFGQGQGTEVPTQFSNF